MDLFLGMNSGEAESHFWTSLFTHSLNNKIRIHPSAARAEGKTI